MTNSMPWTAQFIFFSITIFILLKILVVVEDIRNQLKNKTKE